MDNRLFLTALVVTLSWISLGTNAQNGTTPVGNNVTTAVGNNVTNVTTAVGNNVTTAVGNNVTNVTTAVGNNVTNVTTAVGNNVTTAGGNNVTAAGGNNVTTAGGNNVTTAGGNVTTIAGNNTTTGNNVTSGNSVTTTAGNNVTTAGNNVTTTAPPLTPNITVVLLVTPVSKAQCGKQQLCAAEPSQCEPSAPGSCFFLAAKQISGNNFEFGLSGVSNGYIAASLSPGSTEIINATTYVCANNGGVVKFFSTLLNNGQLILTQLNVNSVKGSVSGSKIQCTFAATVPTATTKAGNFALQISTGSFNSTSGILGVPNAQLRSSISDLANPNITVTNTISPNTTTTISTNNAITLQQSMTQAMMITVAVLGLVML